MFGIQKSSQVDSPRPFLSKFILLYPPAPILSSSRSRHSIVVLNSYDDDPNIFQTNTLLCFFFLPWLSGESFLNHFVPFRFFTLNSISRCQWGRMGRSALSRDPLYGVSFNFFHTFLLSLSTLLDLLMDFLFNFKSVDEHKTENWFYWKMRKKFSQMVKRMKDEVRTDVDSKWNFLLHFPPPTGALQKVSNDFWDFNDSASHSRQHFRSLLLIAKCGLREKTSGWEDVDNSEQIAASKHQGSASQLQRRRRLIAQFLSRIKFFLSQKTFLLEF